MNWRLPTFSTVLLTTLFTLAGCNGKSVQPTDEADPQTLTGILLDSAVAGVTYKTDSLSGITNDAGEFQYVAGESITFRVGGIDLPLTVAAEEITPLDIVGTKDISDTSVTNILQLLQSLDSDQNPDNGITVNSLALSTQATELVDFSSSEFSQHPAVVEAIALSGNSNLVDADVAVEHFGQTLINRLDMPLDDPKIRDDDNKTYFLIKGTEPYQGDSLILGKKHFTLNIAGQISAGRKDTSNSIWQLWNRKGRLHQFVYIEENSNGAMRTCWSISPELATECGAQAERYYLFENASDAVAFNSEVTLSAVSTEESNSVQSIIDSAELAVSNVENATLSSQAALEQQQLAELDTNNAVAEAEFTAKHATEQEAIKFAAAEALVEAEDRARIAAEQEAVQLEVERIAKEAQQAALAARQEEAARLAEEEAKLAAESAAQARAEKQAADLAAQKAAAEKEAAMIAAAEAAAAAEASRLEAETKKLVEEAATREATERAAMELAAAQAAAEAQAAAQEVAEKEAADLAAAKVAADKAAADLARQQAEVARLAAEEKAALVAAEAAAAEKRALEIAAAQAAASEEAQRIAATQAEAQRLAAEKAEADRLVAERVEADRLAAEKAEADRLAAEKVEADSLAARLKEAERLANLNPLDVNCDSSTEEMAAAALKLLNETRSTAQTCGTYGEFPSALALRWHDALFQASASHSLDMAVNGFFSHIGSDGLSVRDRATIAGFPVEGYGYIGENLNGGARNISSAHNSLMASDGHCTNIMSQNYTHVGVACAKNSNSVALWTFSFGGPISD